jgi:hypothetical protein
VHGAQLELLDGVLELPEGGVLELHEGQLELPLGGRLPDPPAVRVLTSHTFYPSPIDFSYDLQYDLVQTSSVTLIFPSILKFLSFFALSTFCPF